MLDKKTHNINFWIYNFFAFLIVSRCAENW